MWQTRTCDDYQSERPDDPGHYRNFLAHAALTYSRGLIDKAKRLDAIPCGANPIHGYYKNHRDPDIVNYPRHLLPR